MYLSATAVTAEIFTPRRSEKNRNRGNFYVNMPFFMHIVLWPFGFSPAHPARKRVDIESIEA
ncbi:hypothetical protein [Burkholderia sp. BCC1970]|uniref:hypothetical protein n=1 Tax=Burkholderia sp. BCC1970 TaxID=2817437 RepID=UPI002ABD2B80|nr:hypothetical protein [Burkholderia sp. BCC1970]